MPNRETTELGLPWRHIKTGGIYTVVGNCQIEATNEPGILYRSIDGGPLWARSLSEFLDGRFEPLAIEKGLV